MRRVIEIEVNRSIETVREPEREREREEKHEESIETEGRGFGAKDADSSPPMFEI
jgi:hypothetical protein